MSNTVPSASRAQYVNDIRKLIGELKGLKRALTALGEWRQVESVEETIQLTRELLRHTERPLYH
jgi:hypothetical protein